MMKSPEKSDKNRLKRRGKEEATSNIHTFKIKSSPNLKRLVKCTAACGALLQRHSFIFPDIRSLPDQLLLGSPLLY